MRRKVHRIAGTTFRFYNMGPGRAKLFREDDASKSFGELKPGEWIDLSRPVFVQQDGADSKVEIQPPPWSV